MIQSELLKRMTEEVNKIPIVDTHEHLMSEEERLKSKIDFFYFFSHYASSDLVSAGMSQEVLEEIRNPDNPLEERWEKFKPYWEDMKNTAYGRALLIAAKDLFDVVGINDSTWRELSEKVTESNKKGWYRYVLKERGKIRVSIYDAGKTYAQVDPDFFAPVMRFDQFVTARTREELNELEKHTGCAIHSLDDMLTALDKDFERVVKEGIVGIKTGLAYQRILRYDKVPRYSAERLFDRIFTHLGEGISWQEAKPLQDFIMHQVIQRAIAYGLPIQIHTGLQEGNGNIITNSNPTNLINLFFDYKEAKFDIFHGSYPYQGELAVLAKNFPNVYVDMCWLHVISPSVSRRALHDWIETVPGNKIFGFGGDYIFVEGAYAHSRMARQGIARVLAEKIEEGYLEEEEALPLAKKLLHDNAAKLFKLEK